ncbi:hypothetical protein J2S40_001855 [Nocardioides luteus]|uniref:hypothetical protein n=1 Tax=Nocardioides luteus TaxID=1844 RepID=UPI001E3845DC|nr:hypothetical protein [Nocardioides luteus]MDR7310797.1 hypothetical protein [Nocardioides luteus]
MSTSAMSTDRMVCTRTGPARTKPSLVITARARKPTRSPVEAIVKTPIHVLPTYAMTSAPIFTPTP